MVAIEMEMPKSCATHGHTCPLYDTGLDICSGKKNYKNIDFHKRPNDCPLTEIEQSEDCISREKAIESVNNAIAKYIPTFIGSYEKIPLELALAITNVPPVTPTQGTCKDCINECTEGNGEKFSESRPTFYCADFEKRGNENGR